MAAYTCVETYEAVSMFFPRPRLSSTGKPVHAWSRWYWPVALVVALALFFVPFLAGASLAVTGVGLAAGALLIGVPELAALCTGNDQDTLSEWVWAHAHITRQPISRWNAARLFLLIGYLFVVGCIEAYLFELSQAIWQFWLLFAIGIPFFGVWLMFHFFERWWR
jgi:hypothetical protein